MEEFSDQSISGHDSIGQSLASAPGTGRITLFHVYFLGGLLEICRLRS